MHPNGDIYNVLRDAINTQNYSTPYTYTTTTSPYTNWIRNNATWTAQRYEAPEWVECDWSKVFDNLTRKHNGEPRNHDAEEDAKFNPDTAPSTMELLSDIL